MIFDYYHDGYAGNGDVGLAEFEDKAKAAAFIQERMARAEKPNLSDYTVIEGRKITPLAREVATRIDL
jgi:hypothetical protein